PSQGDPVFGADGGTLAIKDIDGDGTIEVAFAALSLQHDPATAVYIFNGDGTTRRIIHPTRQMTYGEHPDQPLPGPWVPYHLFVRCTSLFVVFIHSAEFPTLLLELDAKGNQIAEYWSDGYIETVQRSPWHGRNTLLVGGTTNELKDGALAIFE